MPQDNKLPRYPVILTSNQGKVEDDCACENRALVLRFSDQLNFESDCACVVSSTSHALENKSTQSYLQARGTYTTKLGHSHWVAFSPYAPSGPSVLNQAAWERWRLFAVPRSPVWNADQVFAMQGLIVPLRIQPALVAGEPASLTSWLHLTDRCNLRCDYCYLPHVREDMSSETGRAAIDATFRSALANGFKQVKLKYAGGEPLLRFPLIVEQHRYAQSLAEKYGLGLEGVVLSNGTLLTESQISTLCSLNLRLMISLDGLGAHHDAHRRYAGGRGTFPDVAEAVDLALANGLTPNISVTISSRTAEGLPEVMAWILERDLPFSLNFYRENELSASHEDMRLDEQKIINGMLTAFKVIENNLPRRPFLGGIIDRANLSVSHTHTCGVGQNYLVFDQHGQAAKCQMHIRKPITDVHVADPLAVIRADQIGIQNLSVEEKEGCKTCEWKHWCAGGCPLATYRATGRYDVKSPNCNIYKALFPEALRLEGLRLLKYQDDPEVVQKIVA